MFEVILAASALIGIAVFYNSSYEPPSSQYNPTRNQGLWFKSILIGGIGGFLVGFILATVILNMVHAGAH